MGLFDKKTCAVCGEQSGVITGLFGETLAGGEYLCGKCRQKCTPDKNLNFRKMTIEDVKANMAIAEANRKKGISEFKATRRIQIGKLRDQPGLDLDETHGWMMNAEAKDGWVYNLNDVFNFSLVLGYEPLSAEETFSVNTSKYPELPVCPEGIKISSAKLVIWLRENELGKDQIELELASPAFMDEDSVLAAYASAHEFFEFMKSFKTAG